MENNIVPLNKKSAPAHRRRYLTLLIYAPKGVRAHNFQNERTILQLCQSA